MDASGTYTVAPVGGGVPVRGRIWARSGRFEMVDEAGRRTSGSYGATAPGVVWLLVDVDDPASLTREQLAELQRSGNPRFELRRRR